MIRFRAYKTELNPNNEQRTMFRQCAGAARFCFNWALADRIKSYEETGKSGNLYEQKRRFNTLKGEQFPWLYDVPYKLQSSAFANLDTAYKNFFRRVKKGENPGFPKFKSKRKTAASFTLQGCIHVEEGQIKLPIIGWTRLAERDYLPTSSVKILSVNVSERASRWFASLQVEQNVPEPEPAQGEPIGVDVGIKSLAVCSDGMTFENPQVLRMYERKLARLQRELSRRQKGSKNREKTRRKIARMHYKIACVRRHALHDVSYYLTAKTKPSVVAIEGLNVAGMLKNGNLAKSIADASFSELRRQIEYKAKWYGVQVVVAGTFYPSSKTCSGCGYVYKGLTLAEREWICPQCGSIHDRDLNAAQNLALLAMAS